jgi:hypothetical protein
MLSKPNSDVFKNKQHALREFLKIYTTQANEIFYYT